MTKKLENLFDLADDDTPEMTVEENLSITNGDAIIPEQKTLPEIQHTLSAVDKIDAALPTIRDLETSDNELDDIPTKNISACPSLFKSTILAFALNKPSPTYCAL